MDGSVVYSGVLLTTRGGDKRDKITDHTTSRSRNLARLHCLDLPTYTDVVDAFDNDDCLVALFRSFTQNIDEEASSVTDPVLLLKDVAAEVRQLSKHTLFYDSSSLKAEDEAKSVPFRSNHQTDECLLGELKSCDHGQLTYPDVVNATYGGVFAYEKIEDEDGCPSYSEGHSDLPPGTITDVDLLCVFAALISLSSSKRKSKGLEPTRDKLERLILEALRKVKEMYRSQWSDWPFTAAPGGKKERDERTFDALCGSDLINGRKNTWVSLSKAWSDACEHSVVRLLSSLKSRYENATVSLSREATTRVYAGQAVHDIFNYLPWDVHDVLFGEKLSAVLKLSYTYSLFNMPYLLAADTNPVIASELPAIVPSGCRVGKSVSLISTSNMTLASRHAIPSTRKLGRYLLQRSDILHSDNQMGRAVAECMVDHSTQCEQAIISNPDLEICCLENHIQKLFTRQGWSETCGICDSPLDPNPNFIVTDYDGYGPKAYYDYFPLHAFMDTVEAEDKTCSASLCPDCTVRTVHHVYERVTSGLETTMKEAFRCPCCDEYMINWLGRCHEFSAMCQRLIQTPKACTLKEELIKRMECCFSTLEVLQCDFMSTACSPGDYLPAKESMFIVVDKCKRPPVRRYKLTEGAHSGDKCALACVRCIAPICCGRPDESVDIETIDVPPPPTPYSSNPYDFDVEDDALDDEPTDELLIYDDGPGTHKWPTRLSCSFTASNSKSETGDRITSCQEAVAVLGRIPKKKIRGWNEESPEGKAIIALANWQRNGAPPADMHILLGNVSAVYRSADCFCVKAQYYPCLAGRLTHRQVLKVDFTGEIPLVKAYFTEKDLMGEDEANLVKYADLFTRNLVSESLLQLPECIFHRASSFVLDFADDTLILGKRPDVAAELDYVKSLNIARRCMASSPDGSFSAPTYTPREDRTVEWIVEKGGEHMKTVTCFNCKAPAIKRGGCVSVSCDECGETYCWLCEKPITQSDHILLEHGLLYCSSVVARKAFEKLYKIEIATLQLHTIKMSNYGNDEVDVYIMEDGCTFDTKDNRAVRVK